MKKKTYNEGICIWSEGFVSKEFIIDELNRFIDDDEGNLSESILEFYDFIDMPQDTWEVMELFEVKDDKSGVGKIKGEDEFSWHAESYIRM